MACFRGAVARRRLDPDLLPVGQSAAMTERRTAMTGPPTAMTITLSDLETDTCTKSADSILAGVGAGRSVAWAGNERVDRTPAGSESRRPRGAAAAG